MREAENGQLYTLLDRLHHHVEDSDMFGVLVGYSIVASLAEFKTTSGSDQEKRFQEMKAIYGELEKAIFSCQKQGAYSTLCDKRLKVDQARARIGNAHDSRLLDVINDSIMRVGRSYDDPLRRMSLRLSQQVNERGRILGRRNILEEDYRMINQCFGYKRGA